MGRVAQRRGVLLIREENEEYERCHAGMGASILIHEVMHVMMKFLQALSITALLHLIKRLMDGNLHHCRTATQRMSGPRFVDTGDLPRCRGIS
jgi:hypothetical protein